MKRLPKDAGRFAWWRGLSFCPCCRYSRGEFRLRLRAGRRKAKRQTIREQVRDESS